MNLVVLSGNLTADPEVRFTPKGQAVCEFTIAHNKKWRTEDGEQKERVAFIGCVMWGKRAEAFAMYHKKGSKALIRGELIQESWEDKTSGKKQSKTRVQAEEWEFCGAREGGEQARTRSAPPKPTRPEASEPKEDESLPF